MHASRTACHGYSNAQLDPATAVDVVFVERDGAERKVRAPPGKHLLEIAHANEIDLEGACEGSLACRFVFLRVLSSSAGSTFQEGKANSHVFIPGGRL